jgi:two-component system invasion response regulator UvrY
MKKILLVDDHTIIRSGLKMLLGCDLNGYTFDEAANGDAALECVGAFDYDIIIMDINMPGTDSFATVEKILHSKPESRILMFSMNAESIYAKRFLKLGVKGYVRKDEPADEIKQAVMTVLNNRRYISKIFSESLAEEISSNKKSNPFDNLSPRQFEIAQRLIQGKKISDICQELQLHSSTVSTQKNRIYEKLNVDNLVDLYAISKMHLNS